MNEIPSIQWFPGHMTKTKRMMEKCLPLVDAVVEVIDARVPMSSRNPDINVLTAGKPRIIVMNKCDAADEKVTSRWIDYFRRQGVMAIAAERTMIDKLYALADYYLAGTTAEHSRHIYDIYKLLSVVEINDELKNLAVSVAEERKPHSRSLSVQDGTDIKAALWEIVEKNIYESDYKTITESLLFEPVPYETAIKALNTVLESGLFD